jgi:hypothetical protein
MPTIVWILIWAAIFGALGFFVVREIRSGRKQPADFDRLQHQAAAEADMRSHTQGPNGFNQGGWGG